MRLVYFKEIDTLVISLAPEATIVRILSFGHTSIGVSENGMTALVKIRHASKRSKFPEALYDYFHDKEPKDLCEELKRVYEKTWEKLKARANPG